MNFLFPEDFRGIINRIPNGKGGTIYLTNTVLRVDSINGLAKVIIMPNGTTKEVPSLEFYGPTGMIYPWHFSSEEDRNSAYLTIKKTLQGIKHIEPVLQEATPSRTINLRFERLIDNITINDKETIQQVLLEHITNALEISVENINNGI